jgi:hypothetical protein
MALSSTSMMSASVGLPSRRYCSIAPTLHFIIYEGIDSFRFAAQQVEHVHLGRRRQRHAADRRSSHRARKFVGIRMLSGFASSALMNSATCFGVLPGVGSMPTSCSRLNTAGSAGALFIAPLSWSTTGDGVPTGARMAFYYNTRNPSGPAPIRHGVRSWS